jgi:hypothetical protein
MAGFYYDCYALGLKHLGECEGDLFRQTFLDLQSPREHLGDSGELRETNHSTIGDISNVHLAAGLATLPSPCNVDIPFR